MQALTKHENSAQLLVMKLHTDIKTLERILPVEKLINTKLRSLVELQIPWKVDTPGKISFNLFGFNV